MKQGKYFRIPEGPAEITDLTTTRYREREVQQSRIADGKWIASVDGWSSAQAG